MDTAVTIDEARLECQALAKLTATEKESVQFLAKKVTARGIRFMAAPLGYIAFRFVAYSISQKTAKIRHGK
jgi:hypothetical protein